MPPALWLIILPLGAAPVVYLLRRTGLGVTVATGVSLVLAWLALRLPPGLVLNILGRPIELDQLSQIVLTLLFVTAAALFLITFPWSGLQRADSQETPGQGRNLRVMGLATLSIFVAASLSRHLGITAILVEVAAILTVFTIQGRRLDSVRAAQRFLVLMSLALPLFLLAAWQIDQYQLGGGVQPAYARLTALLVGVGFALWLAVMPFHGWLTATAAEAAPPAAAFTLIAFPAVAFSTLIHLLTDTPWLADAVPFAWVMITAGVFTAFGGGMLAVVQRGFSPLLGYAALFDLGCILAGLGLGGEAAVITVLVGLAVRALALTLLAACHTVIRRQTAYDGFVEIKGLARRLPMTTLGLVIGGLTLAGAPLTIGFPLRWQLLQALASTDARWPLLLTLGGLGVTIGYLRGLRALLQTTTASPKERPGWGAQPEPWLLVIIIGLLSAACIALGLFPSLLIEPLQKLAAGIALPLR